MPCCPHCGQDLPAGTARCPRDGALIEPQDPFVGATLAGRYRILSRLARGGMASVYLARHVLIERLSALKILRADLCRDPIQRDRFLREARAVNRINHENIVEITDFGEDGGRVFLVMEYLPGQSLQQRLVRGAMPPARALEIAMQIAAGLGRAHQMGVIHRDLKPDNILLLPTASGAERVKILDFGIAKILDQPSLTAVDRIFGTPGYIAPEYASGGGIDPRADLYSLGVVLYEMVTGTLPFDAEYPGDLLVKHMLEPPIPPRMRRPSVPESVETLVLRLLAKVPAARYHDAFHLLEDLQRVYASLADRLERGERLPFAAPVRAGSSPYSSPPSGDGSPQPPSPEVGAGISGARAWQRFVDALRAEFARRPHPTDPAPFAQMEQVCARMRERADRIEQLKGRMLGLEARGRDFRSTIGYALDALASELSTRARERDAIAAEREGLERQREEVLARVAQGDASASAEADAVLWHLAAAEELLRVAVAEGEDLEFQRAELGRQLERLSEALEADQSELARDIDATLQQIAHDDREMRALAASLPA